MIKPSNYEAVEVFSEYEKIKVGGHACVIKQMIETTTQSGKPKLVVLLDTDSTDSQPNFFQKKYDSNNKPNKKWGCTVQLMLTDEEWNVRKLKTFVGAVQDSNGMIGEPDWENICQQFKNKKVCAVFREEEFEGDNGPAMAIKPYTFRSMADFKAGIIKEPKPLLLKSENKGNDIFGGGDITPVDDGNMPF